MSTRNHIPCTVDASLDARLTPFRGVGPLAHEIRALEDLDAEASRAVSPGRDKAPGLLPSLKLLFAALGAGGSVVPLGDNGRTTRLLAKYAESLRDQ
jgi:hypothetical protein